MFDKRRHPCVIVILFVLTTLLQSCDLTQSSETTIDVDAILGTVEQFGVHEDQFVIRPDIAPSIAYHPISGFGNEFQQAGLRVVFSGNIEPFPTDPSFDASYPHLSITHISIFSKMIQY